MANSPVDKSKEFIDKGMTLITELSSEKHLKKVSKDKKEKMILSDALVYISIPFVLTTIFFGLYKGENIYYDSDDYNGNGTAH